MLWRGSRVSATRAQAAASCGEPVTRLRSRITRRRSALTMLAVRSMNDGVSSNAQRGGSSKLGSYNVCEAESPPMRRMKGPSPGTCSSLSMRS